MKNRIIKTIKNANLKNKLIYIYVGGIAIPIVILSLIYCWFAISNTRENMKHELEYDISEIAGNIEKSIEQGSGISDRVYYDTSLMNILKKNNGDFYDYIEAAKQIDLVARYHMQYDSVEKITIYTHNDNLYRSGVLARFEDITNDGGWYDAYLKKNQDISFISYVDGDNKSVLSLVRKLDYISGVQDIMKIDFSYAYIKKQLKYTKYDCDLQLWDKDDNTAVISGGQDEVFGGSKADCIEKKLSFPDNYSILCKYRLKITLNQIMSFLIPVLVILISVLCGNLLLIKPIISKLDMLARVMGNIPKEQFTRISEDGMGSDELGTLIKSYNRAISYIDVLINQVYSENLKRIEIENEKNKAKFMLLTGQLNPHFIFNVLEMVRMNKLIKEDGETSQLIYEMSMIIRNIISWKEDLIELRQEMEVVRAYLDLSSYSFENDIDINIDISDEALNCIIPKMAVQVLAENAVRHGLDNVSYKRKAEVKAAIRNDRLIISVADNGVGMSSKLVDAINEKKSAQELGIGISNVIERLRIYYGDDASLKVQSSPCIRTEFTLNIPINTKRRDE